MRICNREQIVLKFFKILGLYHKEKIRPLKHVTNKLKKILGQRARRGTREIKILQEGESKPEWVPLEDYFFM